MTQKGLIIVISAPSGAGKTTLCRLVSKTLPKIKYSISCTTRPKREGEKNKHDYYFLSKEEFVRTIKAGGFAEWALVHGNYYGTPKKALNSLLSNGFDVIMDIDVQGGLKIKKAYADAVLIFVMAPSLKELEDRLNGRNKDDKAVIAKRMRNASEELKQLPRYDYLVINKELKTAQEEIEEIIKSEHKRTVNIRIPKFG
jgi:guanylate kinase